MPRSNQPQNNTETPQVTPEVAPKEQPKTSPEVPSQPTSPKPEAGNSRKLRDGVTIETF